MNQLFEKFYFSSPIAIQNMAISAYGYKLYRERYIGNHDRYLHDLVLSQQMSSRDLDQFVDSRFVELFFYAAEHVPYYRDFVRSAGICKSDIRGVADIAKLPILSKEAVRENPEQFVSDQYDLRDLISINTSGTTGKTLRIYVDKDSRRYSYAFFSRFKSWAGLDISARSATFAGRTIVPPDETEPPFWRRNVFMNNVLFSSYHLTERNMDAYISALSAFQPTYIDSYPSSIYFIANYMKERGISGIRPKAVITSSETLLDYQRLAISEAFDCPVFDQYGSAEQVVFISQCASGSYHVNPEYGYIEYLRDDDSAASAGEAARLVCTGFTNRAMPLFRYDIGDTAVSSSELCVCGRSFPVLQSILGRTDDLIVLRDGRTVGRLDPVFKGLISIKEAQIVQEELDRVVLKVVPGIQYDGREAGIVVHELKKRLGSQVEVDVEIVTHIERSSSGKFRSVISRIGKR